MQPQYAHSGERALDHELLVVVELERAHRVVRVLRGPAVGDGRGRPTTSAIVLGSAGSGSGVIARSSRRKLVTARSRCAASASRSGAGGALRGDGLDLVDRRRAVHRVDVVVAGDHRVRVVGEGEPVARRRRGARGDTMISNRPSASKVMSRSLTFDTMRVDQRPSSGPPYTHTEMYTASPRLPMHDGTRGRATPVRSCRRRRCCRRPI